MLALNFSFENFPGYFISMKSKASLELEDMNKLLIASKLFSIISRSLRTSEVIVLAIAKFANKFLRVATFAGSVKSLLISTLEEPELEEELE